MLDPNYLISSSLIFLIVDYLIACLCMFPLLTYISPLLVLINSLRWINHNIKIKNSIYSLTYLSAYHQPIPILPYHHLPRSFQLFHRSHTFPFLSFSSKISSASVYFHSALFQRPINLSDKLSDKCAYWIVS